MRTKGENKSFIRIKNIPILQRAIDILKKLFDEIILVTNSPAEYHPYEKDCNIVTDILKGLGPLSGIHSALIHTSKEGIFCVACDMPFLHIGLINRLLDATKDKRFDCIIPCSDKGIEPLHAVYSKGILSKLEDSLVKKELSVRQLLKNCNCKYIKARTEEIVSFFNVNIQEDLKEIGLHKNYAFSLIHSRET